MAKKICTQCGKEFQINKADDRRGRGKYCSHACCYRHRSNGESVEFEDKFYYFDAYRGYYKNKQSGKGLHCAIWESAISPIPKGYIVHHVDENPKNNSINNLQLMSRSDHQRLHNARRKASGEFSSGFPGVHWHQRDQKWIARNYSNGKPKNLGHFDCELEAANACELAEGRKGGE